ncbi:MAG: hypothetical protein WCO00_05525 [Rhodospirillaceae bacterium]
MNRICCVVITILTGVLPAPAARADLVVIRGSGGAPETGRVLAAGAALTLPAGASVTLLGQDGRILTLAGPYNGNPETGGGGKGTETAALAAVARLLTAGGADSGTLGVSRGGSDRNPYAIDHRGGLHCQAADRAPVFARQGAGHEARLRITSAAGNEAEAVFAEGAGSAPWPAGLLFDDGAYALRTEGQTTPARLTVRRAPAEARDVVALTAWMAVHGCAAQARAILARLP